MYISQYEQQISAYTLVPSSKFARAKRKLIKKNRVQVAEIKVTLETLRTHPYHPFLKTHGLTIHGSSFPGKLYASSVNWMYRILWYFEEGGRIILYHIGPHSGFNGVY